ncbi:MAG: ABC transporter substrate-binding protein [Chloroflexi bacterium]|nr:ABC transporter substrate-binding protein [Chloroflexota bacterium]
MRRWFKLPLVAMLLVVALPLAACGSDGSSTDNEPYKVGAVFAVTGFNSPLGTPEKQTVDMMVKQINDNGGINGHPLEVTVYDTKSDSPTCLIMAQKLIDDGVVAIIGPSGTGESLAIVDAVTAAQIPLVACAAGQGIVIPDSTKPNEPRYWVFSTPQFDVFAVTRLYQYMKDHGITRIATISDTGGFGKSGKAVLEDATRLASYGLTLTASETFDPVNDTSMQVQLSRIKNSSPDAVICWGTNPGPALVARDMKTLGMQTPLFCSHGIANKEFITVGGSAVNGVILPAGKLSVADQLPESDAQKQVLVQYKSDFESIYGTGSANGFGGYAYDALSIVVAALTKAGPDRAKVRDEIEKTTNFAGTAGIFNMSSTNHNGLQLDCFVMVKIVDGKWTWLQS